MGKLTALTVKNLKKPGRHQDGNGLMLYVTTSGSKTWVHRLMVGGKRTDHGLGAYPVVSLAQARDAVINNKRAVLTGQALPSRKPVEVVTAPTFRKVFWDLHEKLAARAVKETEVIHRRRAELYILPVIGDLPVDQITKAIVLDILLPIWETKPATAKKVRSILKAVLSRAMVTVDTIHYNAAGDHINAALESQPSGNNYPSIPHNQLAEGLRAIDNATCFPQTKLAIKFMVLTAARTVEIRRSTWSEIDLDKRVWVIPPDKMKTKKAPHRVPLSNAALEVLRQAVEFSNGNDDDLIFPSTTPEKSPMLGQATLNRAIHDAGIDATAHGMRATFKTWSTENEVPWELSEVALSHRAATSTVSLAYLHTDMLELRRPLMEAWAEYLLDVAAPVEAQAMAALAPVSC